MLKLRYPLNAEDFRKSRSLAGIQYPRNNMIMYPMYGYYVPNAFYGGVFPTRTPILNDSDSSDDDIPLSQVKSRELNNQTKKLKKITGNSKVKKSETARTDHGTLKRQEKVNDCTTPCHDEVFVDVVEECSEITLVDNNSTCETEQGNEKSQNIIKDGGKNKIRYFSHLRKLFKNS